MAKIIPIKEPTDGGNAAIEHSEPYSIVVTIEGSADFLFHRWNAEAVEEKARTAKNSRGRKTDNIESYVYRIENRDLAIPGEYLRSSIIAAAKFRQDPRSPRKSAMDLFKAVLAPFNPHWPLLNFAVARFAGKGASTVQGGYCGDYPSRITRREGLGLSRQATRHGSA